MDLNSLLGSTPEPKPKPKPKQPRPKMRAYLDFSRVEIGQSVSCDCGNSKLHRVGPDAYKASGRFYKTIDFVSFFLVCRDCGEKFNIAPTVDWTDSPEGKRRL